jgi:hypothetical protein
MRRRGGLQVHRFVSDEGSPVNAADIVIVTCRRSFEAHAEA